MHLIRLCWIDDQRRVLQTSDSITHITKKEFDFSAQSSMSSIGGNVLNVLFVFVRRF